MFLSVVGPASYKLSRNLVSSAKPGEKSYEELHVSGPDGTLQPDSIGNRTAVQDPQQIQDLRSGASFDTENWSVDSGKLSYFKP